MVSLDKCIHCHLCRENCNFLSKYGIDICDTDKLRGLAYHCFLCGKCTEVCPAGIDGRGLVMDMRREHIISGGKDSVEITYKNLIGEKRDYKFRNWKHATSGSIFFPGCNFPSMYPKTNKVLTQLFDSHGIGTVYDCCGKPIAELGLEEDEWRITQALVYRLKSAGIKEIITACPNCKDFFGDRLGVKVRSVYDKLSELKAGKIIKGDIVMYIPCPDRTDRIWLKEIRPFIEGEIIINDSAQCCGLGGSAAKYEPDIADGFISKLKDRTEEHVYTYCASCMGRFARRGFKSADHILPYIMATNEKPDTGKSYINRVMTKIR